MEQKMTAANMAYMIFLFMGSFTLFGGFSPYAGSYNWLASIIAAVIGIFLLFCCIRLLSIYKSKNLFEIFSSVLGVKLGTAINLLYIFSSIVVGTLITRLFTEFTNLTNLNQTPKFIIAAVFTVTCTAIAFCGIENLSRIAYFVFPVIIIFVLSMVIISVKNFDWTIITIEKIPDGTNMLKASIHYLNKIFCQTVFLMAGVSVIERPKNFGKSLAIGYSLVSLVVAGIIFRNISVLGYEVATEYCFPSYSASSVVSVGQIFERIEVVVSAILFTSAIFEVTIYIISAAISIKTVFKANYKTSSIVVGAVIYALSLFMFDSTFSLFKCIDAIAPYMFAAIGLPPLIIWPFAEYHNYKKLSQQASGQLSLDE